MDKELVLNEAIRIGNQLLEEAKSDADGLYWETMDMDMDRNISFRVLETLYSGSVGVVLFFQELYRVTGDKQYLETAVKGMDWTIAYCRKNPPTYFALITGRMGVPLALTRMHEFAGETDKPDGYYLKNALELARPYYDTKPGTGVDDLIGGTSGTLLGLMHLHAATARQFPEDESWLLESIDSIAKGLIQSAHHGPRGLYWDLSDKQIDGLCGFSHGAAGLGFVFLEIGRYFQNDTYYKLAEQAFLYEQYYFKEEIQNWPDLRKGIYTDEDREEHLTAYREGNNDFFTESGNMSAWCHGAPGIGLARVRAYQLLGKESYKKDTEIAVKTTSLGVISADDPERSYSHILCHGGGGNADLFIDAYRVLGQDSFLELAANAATNAVKSWQKNKYYLPGFGYGGTTEDRSLFMGIAGVGYFYLRLLDPHTVPSVLAPALDAEPVQVKDFTSTCPNLSISTAELQERLLQLNFQRTMFCAKQLLTQQTEGFLRQDLLDTGADETPVNRFIQLITQSIPSLPKQEKELMNDVFSLEHELWNMTRAVESRAMLAARDIVLKESNEKLLNQIEDLNGLIDMTFKLEPGNRLMLHSWQWDLDNEDQWQENVTTIQQKTVEPDEFTYLLSTTPWKIVQVELSPFAYTILLEFQEACHATKALEATIEAFETLSPEQEVIIKEKFIQQVEQFVKSGVLVQA